MKPSSTLRPFGLVGIIVLTSAVIILNSCIFEAPGDNFYRTMWNASQLPSGALDTESLTLEFLCSEQVTIKDGSGIIIAHGTYSPDCNTAVLEEVIAVIDDVTVTFLEAHRNADTLFLLWKPDGQDYAFTTAMDRKSSYEQIQ